MFKRLLLISLVLALPIQGWAASNMQFKHQVSTSSVEILEPSHTCHQVLDSSSEGEPLQHSPLQADECNSCSLCMGFGYLPFQVFTFPMTFNATFDTISSSFESHNVLALIKPPIL